MPGQFMKQESFMGLNLICRNWSSIIGIQQIATTLCKKKSSIQETLTLLTDADRSTDDKRNPFFGVSKKKWGGVRMGSENKNFHFLFWRGDTWGGTLGVTEGGCVTYHLLVQYNAVQLCSRVQVRPAVPVGWFPKNRYSWKTMKYKKVLKIKYMWNNTCNMCHFTCDTLGWIHILSKVHVPSSYG